MNGKEIAKAAYEYLDERKAVDIKIIDISKISTIADYFIIAGASNIRQVKALADNVEEKLAKAGCTPKNIEGYQTANWILMDYIDVVIHIFNQEQRIFYDLERIWAEGRFIEPADL